MIVQQVRLQHFRNHTDTELEFGTGINVLVGKNGQGKTNILEAISCLSLTKSFYAASDGTLVQFGSDVFEVDGVLRSDSGTDHHVRLAYGRETAEKVFTINGTRPDRLVSVIGMFPVVILSPEGGAITFGAPSERRKFIDLLLSQLSRAYFEDLLEYRQVLRQRNKLLVDAKLRGIAVREDLLGPWNAGLVQYGGRIIHRRRRFINEFLPYVKSAYLNLVEAAEEPGMVYESVGAGLQNDDPEAIATTIQEELQNQRSNEQRRGVSLVGPHRDDLIFSIKGVDLKNYASQGQHKTFLVALKVAEFLYLKDNKDETPMLLLDDVLSELDGTRSSRLLNHIAGLGQTIITTTDESVLSGREYQQGMNRRFHVEEGTCRQVTVDEGSVDETTSTTWRSAE